MRCASPTAARRSRRKTILVATGGRPNVDPQVAGHRARHHVERGISAQSVAEAHRHRRRRIHRGRVRRHLRRSRRRDDADLSRRKNPARLRRGPARRVDRRRYAKRGITHRHRQASSTRIEKTAGGHRPRISPTARRSTPTRSCSPSAAAPTPRASASKGRRRRSARGAKSWSTRTQRTNVDEHLCRRRRMRSRQPDAGRDPRGARLRRYPCSATSRAPSIMT